MPIAEGTRLDRYQVISPIGAGGMGEVYLAQDTKLGRKVAIKLLPPHYTQDPERLRRFEQEAFAASSLNHPNIITIYEIGEAEGRLFIVTEFIEGQTLRRRLAAGRIPPVKLWRSPRRSPVRWQPRITQALFIAISSRKT